MKTLYVKLKGAQPEQYEGMRLIAECGSATVSRIISSADDQVTFRNLEAGNTCLLTLKNAYGDILAQKTITTDYFDMTVEIEPLQVVDISATAADAESKEIRDGYSITWFNEDGTVYSAENPLTGVPVGRKLVCRVYPDAALSKQYMSSEILFVVPDASTVCTVILSSRPSYTLSGRVLFDDVPISGAKVLVEQVLEEKYLVNAVSATDENGNFSVKVFAGAAEMTVACDGYSEFTQSIAEINNDSTVGDISLDALSGAVITISGEISYAAETGDNVKETLTDFAGIRFTGYNKTRNTVLDNIVFQANCVVIASGVEPGDEVDLTAESLTDSFASFTTSVVMDVNNTADAIIQLMEYGIVRILVQESENKQDRVLIFNEDGDILWTGVGGAGNTIESGGLKQGTNKVIVMGSSEFVTYPQSLQMLQQMGLVEGTDYVAADIETENGRISTVAFDHVPFFDESRYYYTEEKGTSVYLNKTAIDKGKYVVFYAAALLQEKYREHAADYQWIVELPDGLALAEGSISIAEKECTSYSAEDNRIVVPVTDPSEKLRIYFVGAEEGEWEVSAYLQFTMDAKTISQPVGNAAIKVGAYAFSFDLPDKTLDTQMTLSGSAPFNSIVEFYDNDTMVCHTQASAGGIWKAEFELYEPYTYSKHTIYAVIQPTYGSAFRSESQVITYQYTEAPPKLEGVTMIYGRYSLNFEFSKNSSIQHYYSYSSSVPSFTFLIMFSGNISGLKDVELEVSCTNGSLRTLESVWNEAKGCFVATGDFYSSALPTGVSVNYDYDADLIISAEEENNLTSQLNEFTELWNDPCLDDLMGIINNPSDLIISDDEMLLHDEESTKEVEAYNAEVYQLSQEYNQIISDYAEYNKLKQDLTSAFEVEACSANEVRVTFEDEVVTITNNVEVPAEEKLLEEGYKKVAKTDGSSIYILPLETKEVEGKGASDQTKNVEVVVKVVDTSTKTSSQFATTMVSAVVGAGKQLVQETTSRVAKYSNWYNTLGLAADVAEGIAQYMTKNYKKHLLDCSNSAGYLYFSGIIDKERYNEKLHAFSRTDEITGKLSQVSKWAEKVGNACAGLGMLSDSYDVYSMSKRISELDELLKKDPSNLMLKDLRDAYWRQMASSVMLIVGGGATIFVSWTGLGLIAGGTITAAVDYYASWQKDELDRRYEKYMESYKPPYQISSRKGSVVAILDPSGYVYEAVASNRVEGVKTTLYQQVKTVDIYDEEHITTEIWDAVPYDQSNPLITDELGQYQWDVPDGQWQVKFEKTGYETAYSEWLTVPPPQLDVNVGIVSYAAPTVTDIQAYTDYIQLTFSRYLKVETVNTENLKIWMNDAEISGRIELVDAETSPMDSSITYVSVVKFVFDASQTSGSTVTIQVAEDIESYAGVNLTQSVQKDVTLMERPQSLTISELNQLQLGETTTVTIQALPASVTAGMKVIVPYTSMLLDVSENELTLDEDGKAVLTLSAQLPGTAVLSFELEGTELSVQADIDIVDEYTITFVDQDGQPLQSTLVRYGSIPEYSGAEPVKTCTEDTCYQFTGWTPAVEKAVCDAVYTANFSESEHQWHAESPVVDTDGNYTFDENKLPLFHFICSQCEMEKIQSVPKTTAVQIFRNDENITGKTITVDLNRETELDLAVILSPDGAAGAIRWSSSDKKATFCTLTDNGDGTAHVSLLPDAKMTTLTFTATEGISKKTAKVTVTTTRVSTGLTIASPKENLELNGTDSVKLIAVLEGNPKDKTVSWSLSEEDRAYATVSGGTLRALDVTESHCVTLKAVAKDGGSQVEVPVWILPKSYAVRLSTGGELLSSAYMVYLNDTTEVVLNAEILPCETKGDVKWSGLKTGKDFDVIQDGNTLTIRNLTGKTGTYTITAQSTDKGAKKATVKLTFARRAESIQILSSKGTELNDELAVVGKKTYTFKDSVTISKDKAVTDRRVLWSLDDTTYASISKGKLTVKSFATDTQRTPVVVTVKAALAADESICSTWQVKLIPNLSSSIQIQMDGTAVNGSSWKGSLAAGSAEVSAICIGMDGEVTWTPTNEKGVAYYKDGRLIFNRTGSVTLTASGKDGSGKAVKTSIKVSVVRYTESLTIYSKTGANAVTAGKSLSMLVSSNPSKPTNSKVTWSLNAEDARYATIDTKGTLKAAKVTAQYTVTVHCVSQDNGTKAEAYPVTIYPAVTSVRIFQGATDVTGKTIEFQDGLELIPKNNPGTAQQNWTVKTSNAALLITPEEGTNRMIISRNPTKTLKSGTKVTITFTASDGSGKSAKVVLKVPAA